MGFSRVRWRENGTTVDLLSHDEKPTTASRVGGCRPSRGTRLHVLVKVSPDLFASNRAGRFHSDAAQRFFRPGRTNECVGECRQALLKQGTKRHYGHKGSATKDV